ncbi:MAG: GIY-YIG nuclease family protein [Methylomonas sp.]|jgi:hypothetical protein|uniref:GIY-YIG nuclease family protein n=1 Tax=Methylomonas sp. TaxID=418 RepID=UPI0025E3F7F6|nr:GIY-YIG nuclease family protein [Methylomonas sp.]MCK9607524.1 GIY-YIG nuclease family protein [Methylomonas sp.]
MATTTSTAAAPSHFIYAMTSQADLALGNFIKVGYSQNPRKRLCDYQTGRNPLPAHTPYFIAVWSVTARFDTKEDIRAAEKSFHDTLRNIGCKSYPHSEWFSATVEQIHAIAAVLMRGGTLLREEKSFEIPVEEMFMRCESYRNAHENDMQY